MKKLIIVLVYLFSFFQLHAHSDSLKNESTSYEINIFSNYLLNTDLRYIDLNSTQQVFINNSFNLGLSLGLNIKIDFNLIAKIRSSLSTYNYEISFRYNDTNGNLGYSINDRFKKENVIFSSDLSIGKQTKLFKKRKLTYGVGCNALFQTQKTSTTDYSALNNQTLTILILRLETIRKKELPNLSSFFYVDFEIIKFKKINSTLNINIQYNYSNKDIINGTFFINDGNQNFNVGTISLKNHYLQSGLILKINN